MLTSRLSDLQISKKVEILYHLFHGNNISSLIDGLENSAIIELQKFVWEKTVEFGIKCRGKNFSRKEVTRKMTPTPTYQRQQGCSEPQYLCKGTHCIHSNPACAIKKLKEHVDIMAESIWEYISRDV